jgi:glyoxylase-like metal-dependent hydrolase (beta-lactamase superfamily II)
MDTLASGISYFDLQFQNRPRVIASAVLHGPGGVAIVDPGPSSTLATFRRELAASGISVADLTAILLTHIHLDHAGATGTLVRENPNIRVYVHERGAPHMIEPAKLIASAARLYGDDAMDTLWGEFAPVPRESITVLSGGERIEAGGRPLEVAYTPGHASHHVSYFHEDSGEAFVGDTAGVRIPPYGFTVPPTPPPDIDLEAWSRSLDTIEEWGAGALCLTHFGAFPDVGAQIEAVRRGLTEQGELARENDEAGFVQALRARLAEHLDPDSVKSFEQAAPPDQLYQGLERYWRKREEASAA